MTDLSGVSVPEPSTLGCREWKSKGKTDNQNLSGGWMCELKVLWTAIELLVVPRLPLTWTEVELASLG